MVSEKPVYTDVQQSIKSVHSPSLVLLRMKIQFWKHVSVSPTRSTGFLYSDMRSIDNPLLNIIFSFGIAARNMNSGTECIAKCSP